MKPGNWLDGWAICDVPVKRFSKETGEPYDWHVRALAKDGIAVHMMVDNGVSKAVTHMPSGLMVSSWIRDVETAMRTAHELVRAGVGLVDEEEARRLIEEDDYIQWLRRVR